MVRAVLVVAALVVGCDVPADKHPSNAPGVDPDEGVIQSTDAGGHPGSPPRDAPAPSTDAAVSIDAPTPSVDAGPPPEAECKSNGNGGMMCEVPPSECLDGLFLLRYTDAQCVAKRCVYTREIVYCPGGCSNGACN